VTVGCCCGCNPNYGLVDSDATVQQDWPLGTMFLNSHAVISELYRVSMGREQPASRLRFSGSTDSLIASRLTTPSQFEPNRYWAGAWWQAIIENTTAVVGSNGSPTWTITDWQIQAWYWRWIRPDGSLRYQSGITIGQGTNGIGQVLTEAWWDRTILPNATFTDQSIIENHFAQVAPPSLLGPWSIDVIAQPSPPGTVTYRPTFTVPAWWAAAMNPSRPTTWFGSPTTLNNATGGIADPRFCEWRAHVRSGVIKAPPPRTWFGGPLPFSTLHTQGSATFSNVRWEVL
jgi:hypothetical protein